MIREDRHHPGLVVLYDIQPGIGSGLFFQIRSLQRTLSKKTLCGFLV